MTGITMSSMLLALALGVVCAWVAWVLQDSHLPSRPLSKPAGRQVDPHYLSFFPAHPPAAPLMPDTSTLSLPSPAPIAPLWLPSCPPSGSPLAPLSHPVVWP